MHTVIVMGGGFALLAACLGPIAAKVPPVESPEKPAFSTVDPEDGGCRR